MGKPSVGGATTRHPRRRGDPASPRFRIEDSPFFQMHRTIGAYDRAMERALKSVGMDIPRWRVLMLAHERGPVSVGEIARDAVVKLPTATRVVQRLRDEGLLRLSRCARDARVTNVEATAAASEVVATIRVVAGRLFRAALADVADADVTALMRILGAIQLNLRTIGA